MKNDVESYLIPDPKDFLNYRAPSTHYCKTKEEFDIAVGSDFIEHANLVTKSGDQFLVGLSHGQSPSGAYQYILDHYRELNNPGLIHYTFVNSKLKRQRGLVDVRDAISFVKELLQSKRISKDQIIGRSLDRDNIEKYRDGLNKSLSAYLKKLSKKGLDYVFLASTPKGQVAGISRNSAAFESEEIVVVVKDNNELELTFTPSFLKHSGRIAFLATKADKRRTLAWLFYRWAKPNESPGFLKYIDNVEERLTVFVDDNALTWPQLKLKRKTPYGYSTIRLDMAIPFNENLKNKLPVVLMVHGFLGLNTFDAMIAFISSGKYIAAAMHYGSIPHDLPPREYSMMVVENIDFVIDYFGSRGHPVYLFDHSIANTYFLMIDKDFDKLDGVKKYLHGRIGSNPFFGEEAKQATIGFLDNVILPSEISVFDKFFFQSGRTFMPFETRRGVRSIGIGLAEWLIKIDTFFHKRIWDAIKERILFIVSELGTLPPVHRIPMQHTLNRLPMKIFAIQIYSALIESKKFDDQTSLSGTREHGIPVLVLKSDRDPVAKFVSRIYDGNPNVTIMDITIKEETDLFKEHLFYMIHPRTTIKIIDQFIEETEEMWAGESVNTGKQVS